MSQITDNAMEDLKHQIGAFFRKLTGGQMAQDSGIAPNAKAPASSPAAGGQMSTPAEAGKAVGMAGGAAAAATAGIGAEIGQGFASGLSDFLKGLFTPAEGSPIPPGRIAVVWVVIITLGIIGVSGLLRPGTNVAVTTGRR